MNTLLACIALLPAAFGPTVVATDLSGKRIVLPVKGKTTALIFVATDCPIANRLLPEIKRTIAKFKPVSFFFVYPDKGATKREVVEHLKSFGVKAAAILDPKLTLADFAKATATPEAAVYDSKGRLAYHGRISAAFREHSVPSSTPAKNDLKEALTVVVAGKPVPVAYIAPVGCPISRT